mgnify:CR=1 FL=1
MRNMLEKLGLANERFQFKDDMLRIHHFCPHIGQPFPLGGFFHYFEHGGGKVRVEHDLPGPTISAAAGL